MQGCAFSKSQYQLLDTHALVVTKLPKRQSPSNPWFTPCTRKVKPNQSGFYWSNRQWVAVASAGPYASLLALVTKLSKRQTPSNPWFTPTLQTDNHASRPTPPLVFYRPDALPVVQPIASKHWRQKAATITKILPTNSFLSANAFHGVAEVVFWERKEITETIVWRDVVLQLRRAVRRERRSSNTTTVERQR